MLFFQFSHILMRSESKENKRDYESYQNNFFLVIELMSYIFLFFVYYYVNLHLEPKYYILKK
jgi:hypothetical protein